MDKVTYRDLGFTSEEACNEMLSTRQCFRLEVRIHRAKLKHALNRLRMAEDMLLHEKRLKIAKAPALAKMEAYVEQHRIRVAWVERRMKTLLDLAHGWLHEEAPKYELQYQLPEPKTDEAETVPEPEQEEE